MNLLLVFSLVVNYILDPLNDVSLSSIRQYLEEVGVMEAEIEEFMLYVSGNHKGVRNFYGAERHKTSSYILLVLQRLQYSGVLSQVKLDYLYDKLLESEGDFSFAPTYGASDNELDEIDFADSEDVQELSQFILAVMLLDDEVLFRVNDPFEVVTSYPFDVEVGNRDGGMI